MPVIAAAIIGGAALAGTAYSSSQASSAAAARNRQQVNLTQDQMAWEEKMRSTAHQVEVADLKKAGLNPILSGTGGPGASWHSVAPAQVESEYVGADFGGAANSAVGAYQAAKQDKLIEANIDTQRSQADLNDALRQESATRSANNTQDWIQKYESGLNAKEFAKLSLDEKRNAVLKQAQDLNIGQGAVARAKIERRIMEADEGDLFFLAEKLGGVVGQAAAGSALTTYSARGAARDLDLRLPSIKGKFPGAFPDDYGR